MATTPNFSWVTPAPTDFVTDLPADFETFADAVDTDVWAIKGTADAALPETIIDAAGDLIYGSAADTAARLAIGTAGQVLAVNSGATAPEWVTSTSGGMTVITSGTLSGSAVNLTSIPQTYNHLQLVIRQFDPSADGAYVYCRFNNNTSANYRTQSWTDNAGTDIDNTFSNISGGVNGADDTVVSNLAILDLLDYKNTTTAKIFPNYQVAPNATTPTQFSIKTALIIFKDLNAITEINLYPNTGTFDGGSYILYGVK